MLNAALVLLLAASPLSAGASAAEVADDKATKDDYELDVSATTTKIKAGADGAFSLVIRPKNGKKVHPDAPLEVTFKDVKNVRPGKNKLGRNDVVDKAAKAPEVKTTLRGEKAGQASVDASVSFFLCTDAWCQRMTDRVSIAMTVEE